MISKELLSEIMPVSVKMHGMLKNELIYSYMNERTIGDTDDKLNKNWIGTYINIHELAHKCKEWMATYHYEARSYLSILWKDSRVELIDSDGNVTPFTADSEPEVIFKACEWLLKG